MDMEYINKIAPDHIRHSCDDETAPNAMYKQDDFGGCLRCTLLQVARHHAEAKLILALPDYDKRQIVIASDEFSDGERLVCVAIKEAPNEKEGGKKHTARKPLVVTQSDDHPKLWVDEAGNYYKPSGDDFLREREPR